MKKWLKINLLLLSSILISIAGFNYLMNPLWYFNHKHSLQAHQEGFDERQQKLNLIYNHPFKYDGLMLGSSRVTLHNTTLIPGQKIFNLAMDDMRVYEFDSYIEYAKKRNGKDFDTIILGLDFLTIDNIDPNYQIASKTATAEDFWYPYRSLLSYDTLSKSIRNFKNTALGKYTKRFKTYNQYYIADSHPASPSVIDQKVSDYIHNNGNKIIMYNRNLYIQTLKKLKNHNPNTRFIIFITPIPQSITEKLLTYKQNRLNLVLWRADLLRLFGPYYTFMSPSDITQNYTQTFVDHGHYNTVVAQCIDDKILFGSTCHLEKDTSFGHLVNQNNVNAILELTSTKDGF